MAKSEEEVSLEEFGEETLNLIRAVSWSLGLGTVAFRALKWWENEMAAKYPGKPGLGKMMEELTELEAKPGDAEEAADVFIAFVVYCYRMQIPLVQAVDAKMAINEQRKWGEPDENGVVRHITPSEGSRTTTEATP